MILAMRGILLFSKSPRPPVFEPEISSIPISIKQERRVDHEGGTYTAQGMRGTTLLSAHTVLRPS